MGSTREFKRAADAALEFEREKVEDSLIGPLDRPPENAPALAAP
jgi:hypothetical protein